jgi:NADH:ubiquinone oxidoreductase subunit 5 (subunit L)/multisubunit Na+/H+ antiporter MnhA subunit
VVRHLVLLLMASLAGFPPLFGFWAKLAVLRAAIDGGMLWLAIVGVVLAVIGAYYYLRVIKVMYFDEPATMAGRGPSQTHSCAGCSAPTPCSCSYWACSGVRCWTCARAHLARDGADSRSRMKSGLPLSQDCS